MKKLKKITAKEADEENELLEKLHRVSINARRKAFRHNAPVTIIRNGKIIKIYLNKHERVLGIVTPVPLTVDIQKPIRIK